MSICDNRPTTVNQETPLKLQLIRKTKTCRNACKKTFNDTKIRRSTAVLYKKVLQYLVPSTDGTGTLVHGTAHHWICVYNCSTDLWHHLYEQVQYHGFQPRIHYFTASARST